MHDLKGIRRAEDTDHVKGGGVAPRYFEQPPDVPEVVIEEDENGNQIIIKQEEPTPEPPKSGRGRKKNQPKETVIEKEIVKEVIKEVPVEKKLENHFNLEIESDFGLLYTELFDISVSGNMLVICYLPDVVGTKFLPKNPDLKISIKVTEKSSNEVAEYLVSPTGIIFTLETSGLTCTLLEVL